MKQSLLALVLLIFTLVSGFALDEPLIDPILESRAKALFPEIRCMVCQNQSIADSASELAGDLRSLVREQMLAGKSDQQIKSYLTDRYGEYVLFKPVFDLKNALLWFGPLLILVFALGTAAFVFMRKKQTLETSLTDEEEQTLKRLLEASQ